MKQQHPLRAVRAAYVRRRHTTLLALIVVALATRPLIGDSGLGSAMFSVTMLLVLMAAVLTIQIDEIIGEREILLAQRRRRRLILFGLGGVAIVERLYVLGAGAHGLLAGTISWVLFLGFVTWSLLQHLLRHKEVTGETISMSISIYLLMGTTWGMVYAVVLELQPEAFRFSDASLAITAEPQHVLPILIYFSLTTLTTVGFGDISPATLAARYLAIAEGITGQFYLAILVARLVAMHMSRRGESA